MTLHVAEGRALWAIRDGELTRIDADAPVSGGWMTDDFNRPAGFHISENGGLPWSGPDWLVYYDVGNAAYSLTSGTAVALLDFGSPDYELYVDLQRNASTSAGVTARYVDSANSLGTRLTAAGGLGFFITRNGSTTVIQENIIQAGQTNWWGRLGIRCVGDTIDVFWNDALVYTYTVTWAIHRTGTRGGLRAAGVATGGRALYDNFAGRAL